METSQSSLISQINSRQRTRQSSSPSASSSFSLPATESVEELLELIALLEKDLSLAGEIGQSLLDDKEGLERKVEELEQRNEGLLLRVRESGEIERRLDETINHLEIAEAANRALLINQQEDRKKVKRQSIDLIKFQDASSKLSSLTEVHSDTSQELNSEIKRSNLLESKLKKQITRSDELSNLLTIALKDLEEVRQVKVLQLPSVPPKSSLPPATESIDPDSSSIELLAIIETLVQENESLKTNSSELSNLLELSRESETQLQLSLESQQIFGGGGIGEDDDGDKTAVESNKSYQFNELNSSSPGPASFRKSYSIELSNSTKNTRSHSTDSRTRRPRPMGMNNGLGSGVVPIGNGHVRRPSTIGSSAPPSPMLSSPPTFSDIEESSRSSRRQPRPLSLSLGPSLFPVPGVEGRKSPSMISFGRKFSGPPSIPSGTAIDDASRRSRKPSGITLSSPTKRLRRSSTPDSANPSKKIDFSTQTSIPFTFSSPVASPISRTPARTTRGTHNPNESISISSISEKNDSNPSGNSSEPSAMIVDLINYSNKLFSRLLGANIAALEKRLKKQNLSGDVKFLAAANLRDLNLEITSFKTNFSPSVTNLPTESPITKRDFLNLIKLLKNLLFEISRLRSIINVIDLDPTVAPTIRFLDDPSTVPDTIEKVTEEAKIGNGLLAPITRMFGAVLLGASADTEPSSSTATPKSSKVTRGTGGAGISAAIVNVEFNSRNTTSNAAGDSPRVSDSPGMSVGGGTVGASGNIKSGNQVKRDLNLIFAGRPAKSTATSEWIILPTPPTPAPQSNTSGDTMNNLVKNFNHFGRFLGYKSALSSTTNAILDPPTATTSNMTERIRRPRALSDSSIRSTFISSSSNNPYSKLIQEVGVERIEPIRMNVEGAMETEGFEKVVGSLSRKSSFLKPSSGSTASSSGFKIMDIPPVPIIPIEFSTSPAVPIKKEGTLPNNQSLTTAGLFENLSSWASKTVLSPLAIAVEREEGENLKSASRSLERNGGGRDWSGIRERAGREIG